VYDKLCDGQEILKIAPMLHRHVRSAGSPALDSVGLQLVGGTILPDAAVSPQVAKAVAHPDGEGGDEKGVRVDSVVHRNVSD